LYEVPVPDYSNCGIQAGPADIRPPQENFELIDENVAATCRICRRLDGIALALELAAASLHRFSLANNQFALLTNGGRTRSAQAPDVAREITTDQWTPYPTEAAVAAGSGAGPIK
jgi:hypothetical protein